MNKSAKDNMTPLSNEYLKFKALWYQSMYIRHYKTIQQASVRTANYPHIVILPKYWGFILYFNPHNGQHDRDEKQ